MTRMSNQATRSPTGWRPTSCGSRSISNTRRTFSCQCHWYARNPFTLTHTHAPPPPPLPSPETTPPRFPSLPQGGERAGPEQVGGCFFHLVGTELSRDAPLTALLTVHSLTSPPHQGELPSDRVLQRPRHHADGMCMHVPCHATIVTTSPLSAARPTTSSP